MRSTLEMCIILILFLTLTIGLIDFGIGVSEYNTVAHLARQGTRYASVRGGACTSPCVPATANDIRDAVRSKAVGLDPQRVIVTTTTLDCPSGTNSAAWPANNQPGRAVQVVVAYDFTPLTRLLNVGTITLTSTSQLVISQ